MTTPDHDVPQIPEDVAMEVAWWRKKSIEHFRKARRWSAASLIPISMALINDFCSDFPGENHLTLTVPFLVAALYHLNRMLAQDGEAQGLLDEIEFGERMPQLLLFGVDKSSYPGRKTD